MSDLANRIRIRRKELGISQTDLAEKLGIHKNQLSRYERGETLMRVDVLEKLATELQTSPDWLLNHESVKLERENLLTRSEKEILDIFDSIQPDRYADAIRLLRNIAKIVE